MGRRRATTDANAALSDDASTRLDLDWLNERRIGPDLQPRPWAQPR